MRMKYKSRTWFFIILVYCFVLFYLYRFSSNLIELYLQEESIEELTHDQRNKEILQTWENFYTNTSIEDGSLMKGQKVYSFFPVTKDCSGEMINLGGNSGEGKWVCNSLLPSSNERCIIVSIGSRGYEKIEIIEILVSK